MTAGFLLKKKEKPTENRIYYLKNKQTVYDSEYTIVQVLSEVVKLKAINSVNIALIYLVKPSSTNF